MSADNLDAADALLEASHDKFELIRTKPEIGRQRSDLQKGLRSFPVARYAIFYRIQNNTIEIVRVLHSARDINSLFN